MGKVSDAGLFAEIGMCLNAIRENSSEVLSEMGFTDVAIFIPKPNKFPLDRTTFPVFRKDCIEHPNLM